jgi:UDP-N-acetylglucosamine:LPS N-acetylglucosamine transferase
MKVLPLLIFYAPLICVGKGEFIFVPVVIAGPEAGFGIVTIFIIIIMLNIIRTLFLGLNAL